MSNGNTDSPIDQSPWDTLADIYKNCAAYTLVPAALIPFIRDKELCDKVLDKGALLANSRLLASDVAEMNNELQAIYAKHQSRTGPIESADGLAVAIQIQEEYIAWCTKYESTVMPTVEALLTLFEQADPNRAKDLPAVPERPAV